MGRILIIDDEESVTDALEIILSDDNHQVKTAKNVAEADRLLSSDHFDLVFTDLRLPDASGFDLLTRVKEESPETEVILMTAHGSLDITIEAIKKGAYYYLEKPFTPDNVIMLTERTLEVAAIRRENRNLKRAIKGEDEAFGIIGRTPSMRQIYETIRATAPSEASVLIEGESGTGKELIAKAFHFQGNSAGGPFVRINCAAVPRDLIGSELLG